MAPVVASLGRRQVVTGAALFLAPALRPRVAVAMDFEPRKLSPSSAFLLIAQLCTQTRAACIASGGHMLYRGEQAGCALMNPAPDLLDPATYGPEAARAFARVSAMLDARDSPIAPSNGHLAASRWQPAAKWGAPCSVWPLDEGLHFCYSEAFAEWWPAIGSIPTYGQLALRTDSHLERALASPHAAEVLFTTRGGYISVDRRFEGALRRALELPADPVL